MLPVTVAMPVYEINPLCPPSAPFWEADPRSAAELREAAAYLEQCASMGSAQNAMFADHAEFLSMTAVM